MSCAYTKSLVLLATLHTRIEKRTGEIGDPSVSLIVGFRGVPSIPPLSGYIILFPVKLPTQRRTWSGAPIYLSAFCIAHGWTALKAPLMSIMKAAVISLRSLYLRSLSSTTNLHMSMAFLPGMPPACLGPNHSQSSPTLLSLLATHRSGPFSSTGSRAICLHPFFVPWSLPTLGIRDSLLLC